MVAILQKKRSHGFFRKPVAKPQPICLKTAKDALATGISVIPVADDGTKRPLVSWKQYQLSRVTGQKLEGWFKYWPQAGLALVTGSVSGGLEAMDFDDRAGYQEFIKLAKQYGVYGLVKKVEKGYLELTPKGVHYLYRCSEITGNLKLASQINENHGKTPEIKTLIETRGEGGYIIVAPSCGLVHPTGKPYVMVKGGVRSIAVLTSEERLTLHALARSLDQLPKNEVPNEFTEKPNISPIGQSSATRPGDDFNKRATWSQVLSPAGWRWVGAGAQGEDLWIRPGKDQGVSASTNLGGYDLLHVFTTSTLFQAGNGKGAWYTKFHAYALLYHNNDFKAAATELHKQGYGVQQVTTIVK